MSLANFEKEVAVAQSVKANDRIWFPKWIRRYELSLRRATKGAKLPVTRDGVLRFSRMLLANGAPAWQRLQAVRALEAYRNLVLHSPQPPLIDIVRKLEELSRLERRSNIYAAPTDEELKKLCGKIDPREPKWVKAMRCELRVLHYAYDTEKAYIPWIKRSAMFVGTDEDVSVDLRLRSTPQRMQTPAGQGHLLR